MHFFRMWSLIYFLFLPLIVLLSLCCCRLAIINAGYSNICCCCCRFIASHEAHIAFHIGMRRKKSCIVLKTVLLVTTSRHSLTGWLMQLELKNLFRVIPIQINTGFKTRHPSLKVTKWKVQARTLWKFVTWWKSVWSQLNVMHVISEHSYATVWVTEKLV